MRQGVFPFEYESYTGEAGMTALGGLPPYMDMVHKIGLGSSIANHVVCRKGGQGWSDSENIISLILLNLAGGNHVEDIHRLEADEGFCRFMQACRTYGMKRKERRALERRWRKERKRCFPSPSSIFRFLNTFHDPDQEKLRPERGAFIPAHTSPLQGLRHVNADILRFLQVNAPSSTATLDIDATLIETGKSSALYCYDSFKSYQPLNVYWHEQGIFVHTEFRDGNVPAGYQLLRILKESMSLLPEGVSTVRLRSDTAGYQHEVMKYCETGEDGRFGRIEFAIGCDVTKSFKSAVAEVKEEDWQPFIKIVNGVEYVTKKQWAEVCFVPSSIGHSKKGLEYRYIATREPIEEQLELPGMETEKVYPFQTMQSGKIKYKIFGTVTNMSDNGLDLLRWQYSRCGKSEEAHAVLKDDLAGGSLPSNYFGANAVWWWIALLSFNINNIFKALALPKEYKASRLKTIRFAVINVAGRVVERSRKIFIKISGIARSTSLLLDARKRILMLDPPPA